MFPGKSIEQCRKRWVNKHDPHIKHERWAPEEDQIINALFHQLGGKWQKIAKYLQGRPPEAVKNRYYSVIRKKGGSSSGYENPTPLAESEVDAMLNLAPPP
jgi:hypothetical protein